MAIEIEDATVGENDLKKGRSSNSPVFLVIDRVKKSWAAKEEGNGTNEEGTDAGDWGGAWAAIVVKETDREEIQKGLHGAASDLGLSCQMKKMPQGDGKVKILFRAIPRRTKTPKTPAKKAAAPRR